jgi:hypothetical protein
LSFNLSYRHLVFGALRLLGQADEPSSTACFLKIKFESSESPARKRQRKVYGSASVDCCVIVKVILFFDLSYRHLLVFEALSGLLG